MRGKVFLFSAGRYSRKIALCFAIVYGSLLFLTFVSYQDEIIPTIVESEFLIGDEDIDHSPHLQIFQYCQSKLRSNARPFFGWALNKAARTSKSISQVIICKKFLSFYTLQKYRGSSVLLSVFRI
jgi:hypothetical protein